VNFDLTSERRIGLKAQKADDAVLEAIAKARKK